MESCTLSQIYETYVTQLKTVMQNKSTFDGLWGFGNDPKKDPCHMKFYDDVSAYIDGLLQRETGGEEAFAAADLIIRKPLQHEEQSVYWCMIAVHGPCAKLVPLLSKEHCALLRDFYDASYLRRNRLPVQQELYKQLKKHSKFGR